MSVMVVSAQRAAAPLVADLRAVFGPRLRAVVAFGPHIDGRTDAPLSCLGLVESLALADLDACSRRAHDWERLGIATPLLLTPDEFKRSLDAFPLEYGEILRTHERVFGDDPFDGLTIARTDLRRACEAQAKSHMLHLREGFIEAGGRPDGIGDLVIASVPAFAALLRNVARLAGHTGTDRLEATRRGADAAGLDEATVAAVLALESPSAVPLTDPARLFPAYLAEVERLARAVDSWR